MRRRGGEAVRLDRAVIQRPPDTPGEPPPPPHSFSVLIPYVAVPVIPHMFNIDYETFNGLYEIIIVTDFSAVY